MDHLRRLGRHISVPIQADEHGFTGRECPNPECEGYFKVVFGTGLKGENLPCHCPYCGHLALHNHFWTKEQLAYAKSVATRRIVDAFQQDLKELEFEHKPAGPLGIGISLKVKPGDPVRIRHYRERALETEVECDHCTLRYAVYGAFAFCPDCGRHNSLQILEKNLDVAVKLLALAAGQEKEMALSLRDYALENVVSVFDAFGREVCRVHAAQAKEPRSIESLSFQNLEGVRRRLKDTFGFDLASGLDADGWQITCRCFQKRHLMAHKLGIVDGEYLAKVNDPSAILGHRINVSDDEVRMLVEHMRLLGRFLLAQLEAEPKDGDKQTLPGVR